ncbi:MAG: methyl-accepting chemotaxis protein [Chloroflexi bacterium]|nr:methyl-accepting chemotaxis protein [Chloroflexota bacterium]
MLRRVRHQIASSLQQKTVLLIMGVMVVLLTIFTVYDVQAQRGSLDEALLVKGKGLAWSGAAAVGHVLEDAIATGRLTEAQVFDTNYQPIPGTNPQKYHTAFDGFTDANILGIEDAYLNADQDTLFAVAVDVNGYLPTHNTRYTKPLTGDSQADLAGNRTKRLFNDPVGLAAAKNTESFLRQIYNRDTGEIAWDISAPIDVNGQHWGGFRVGISLEKVDANLAATTGRIVIAALLLIAVIGVAAFLIAGSISRPVIALSQKAAQLAEGNLTVQADTRSTDEIGTLARTFNRMAVNLRGLIGSLDKTIGVLSSSASELTGQAQSQAAGAIEQAAAVTEVTATIEELSRTAQQIAEFADHIAQTTGQNLQSGEVAQTTVDNAAAGMATLQRKVETLADRIQALGEKAQQIGVIVNIINEFAGDTHLLALNAAIEAAGAGEHGKRFGVVAAEVKRLSDRVVQATTEIRTLISDVQAATNSAVMAAGDSAREAEHGSTLAGQSGLAITQMLEQMRVTAELAHGISLATQQQVQASEQVARTMHDVSVVAQQAATSGQQSATAAERLTLTAQTLTTLVGTQHVEDTLTPPASV